MTDRPARRPSRRASRPAGTVGGDESVLRSQVPAVPPVARAARHEPAAGAPTAPEVEDLLRAVRSVDDGDVGWGERPGDEDDRLRREVPPHW